jgi:hypothetical protein
VCTSWLSIKDLGNHSRHDDTDTDARFWHDHRWYVQCRCRRWMLLWLGCCVLVTVLPSVHSVGFCGCERHYDILMEFYKRNQR